MELDYFFLVKGSPSFDESGPIIKTFNRLCPGKNWRDGVLYNIAEHSPDPRLLKHHIPYTFLNPAMLKKGKMICLARDPRDVIASGFHYLRHHALTTEKMTIEHYVQDLMDGKIYGTYWEHMRLNWSRRNDPNYLFLFYEDLKADPKGNIKKIDQFIGTNRNDKQLDNAKLDRGRRTFRNIFTGKINSWIKENLKDFGDDFKYKPLEKEL
ncbi:Sulfotransferase 1C4 [Armadillidium vulgare]|nr:Sulfotransferase 1C4 [Armadillidium vulgare]